MIFFLPFFAFYSIERKQADPFYSNAVIIRTPHNISVHSLAHVENHAGDC